MPQYHVFWEATIWAEAPPDAAVIALEMLRNKKSLATEFKVADKATSCGLIISYDVVDAQKYLHERKEEQCLKEKE